MSRQPAQPQACSRIAAVHRRGEAWRFVVLDLSGGAPRLLEAENLPEDASAWITEAQRRHGFRTLVRVAPAAATVARAANLPTGETADTAAALSLLAEARLPGSLPIHRRAAGLIADGGTNGTRAVLLTGWAGAADRAPLCRKVPEVWTTEIASLAFLRAGRGPWAASADSSSGAISVLVTGPTKTAARVLVEDASSPARFRQASAQALAETCSNVGVEAPDAPWGGVVLDPDSAAHVRSQVAGLPETEEWLDEYGIALGAALAAGSSDPLSRALASMSAAPPQRRAPALRRASEWLATPRYAWLTAAACAVLLLLGPLVLAAARLAILEGKSTGLADRARQHADERLRAALYAQLDQSRWPMTKLLADLSAAAPVGVVADTVTLSPEQGIAVQGTAQDPEQVNAFQANLNATGVFSAVRVGRVTASSSGVEFEVSARVTSPHTKAATSEDYAAEPLAVRLYGEGASNTAAPRGASSEPVRHAQVPRPARRADPDEDGSGDRATPSSSASSSRRPSASQSSEPPPPLTAAEISAMDRATATSEWVQRRTFPQKNPGIDAATKARLEEEVRQLRERMDSTRGSGG